MLWGGYSYWGKGIARVEQDDTAKRRFSILFEFHFYDRYNWDRGKKVDIGSMTVTDDFMGEFHRQGLAKEFNLVGKFERLISWREGDFVPNVEPVSHDSDMRVLAGVV